MSYFFATFHCKVTRKHETEINRRIAAIDRTAEFVRHYEPGNTIHGWLERPNDGTNDALFRAAELQQMRQIASEVLGLVIGRKRSKKAVL